MSTPVTPLSCRFRSNHLFAFGLKYLEKRHRGKYSERDMNTWCSMSRGETGHQFDSLPEHFGESAGTTQCGYRSCTRENMPMTRMVKIFSCSRKGWVTLHFYTATNLMSSAFLQGPASISEAKTELLYATINFSEDRNDAVYSNIRPPRHHGQNEEEEEEEESTEYTVVKPSALSMSHRSARL